MITRIFLPPLSSFCRSALVPESSALGYQICRTNSAQKSSGHRFHLRAANARASAGPDPQVTGAEALFGPALGIEASGGCNEALLLSTP